MQSPFSSYPLSLSALLSLSNKCCKGTSDLQRLVSMNPGVVFKEHLKCRRAGLQMPTVSDITVWTIRQHNSHLFHIATGTVETARHHYLRKHHPGRSRNCWKFGQQLYNVDKLFAAMTRGQTNVGGELSRAVSGQCRSLHFWRSPDKLRSAHRPEHSKVRCHPH